MRSILAALFLVMFVAGAVFAQSQPATVKKPANENGQGRGTNQPQASDGIPTVQIQNAPEHQAKSQQDTNSQPNQSVDKLGAGIGIAQTLALVITFGVITFVGVKQLRAYVYANPVFLYFFDEKIYPVVRFRIFNSGVTPAYNLVHRAQIGILDHPPQAGMSLEPIMGNWSAPMSLHKDSEPYFLVYKKDRLFTRQEILKLQAGGCRLYVYGEIRYRDAFRRSRYTQFCHSVNEDRAVMKKITTNFAGKKTTNIHFELAPMGNKAT